MSDLRRNNFVLWKHIKKLKRKYRRLKHKGVEERDADELTQDESDIKMMKQELDMMANDPDLETDLKMLRREMKTVGLGVQTELLRTFYDVDVVNA